MQDLGSSRAMLEIQYENEVSFLTPSYGDRNPNVCACVRVPLHISHLPISSFSPRWERVSGRPWSFMPLCLRSCRELIWVYGEERRSPLPTLKVTALIIFLESFISKVYSTIVICVSPSVCRDSGGHQVHVQLQGTLRCAFRSQHQTSSHRQDQDEIPLPGKANGQGHHGLQTGNTSVLHSN